MAYFNKNINQGDQDNKLSYITASIEIKEMCFS